MMTRTKPTDQAPDEAGRQGEHRVLEPTGGHRRGWVDHLARQHDRTALESGLLHLLFQVGELAAHLERVAKASPSSSLELFTLRGEFLICLFVAARSRLSLSIWSL